MTPDQERRHALAVFWRSSGLSVLETAQIMGVSRSRVASILGDPEGVRERARKQRHGGGTCVGCGAATSYPRGGAPPTLRCAACDLAHRHAAAWSQEMVAAAIRRFADEHGRAPTATEWRTSGGGAHPTSTAVQKVFGSWNAGITAAGLPSRRAGVKLDGRDWSRDAIISAINRWTSERGRTPRYAEWRRAGPDHPSAQTVSNAFGGWSAALDSAATP